MDKIVERVGFVGAGNMAEALVGALVSSGLADPGQILVSDLSEERKKHILDTYGVKSAGAGPLFDQSDVVIIAVKPKDVPGVLAEIARRPGFPPVQKKLVISIAAGVRLESMEKILYEELSDSQRDLVPIIRVMPNTPALVCSGMSGLAENRHARKEDVELAHKILAATGDACRFKEEELDAVTAVSGSGPAYVFYLAEAMMRGAEEAGLSGEHARRLVTATLTGAARMIRVRDEDPAELRRKVTSPGGTTEAAIRVLDEAGVADAVVRAIQAAARRSEELGGKS
ncbi:MAG: pyrroline-5-carboxylate reductase [Deltaproteobacteria bacterium]|nr:pyrroline-5-carboxylate reductase [Deltaproteobacteria bacterium]